MYPVSDAFLSAVQENTRRYNWTGRITTKDSSVYEFSEEDIVKGSGYISAQCCGSNEMELGTVYASEMGITLFLDVDRYTLEDALVELFYHLELEDGSWEEVPMGIFEVSEANRKIKCLEIKAYDYMLRFDETFNGFETIGNAYDFMELCSKEFWNVIQMVFTAVGGWLGYFLGGYDGLLYALVVFMVADYITGVMCAVSDKKLSSAVGFKGICRKVLILMLVGIANLLDVEVIGTGAVLRTAVIFFYLSNEGVSLLENAAHLGLPIPEKLKAILAQLHDRAESDGDDNEIG